jgi:hypothetical protein
MNDDELVIDATNFDDYFLDVRKKTPEKGQVMACYTAMAELVDERLKSDLVYLLWQTDKVRQCVTLLKKLVWADEKDAIRVCKEIAEDLNSGLTMKEIAEKPYKFLMRAYYYVKPEYIPKDDPHWSYSELIDLTQKTEQIGEYELRSKIEFPEEEENEVES